MTLQTNDYNIFKKNASNREICQSNVKKIVNSIRFKNLLHLRPILVNKDMEVMDGQHRLEAAKLLNLPIFYQINQAAHTEDILLLNNNQKSWGLDDYLNFYVSQNNKEYINFANFCHAEQINTQVALTLMGMAGGKDYAKFRRGALKMPQDISSISQSCFLIRQTQELLNKKLFGYKKHIFSMSFTRALASLISLEAFEYNTFIKKLEMRLDQFHRCATREGYFEMLKNIYNYKNFEKLS